MVQVNPTPINLRVKFKKVGNLQYISHLDLVRTMSKIIVRSRLPLWYTEGFNPKPKMVFAAPLSIGTESKCEFLNIRLTERIDPELAREMLNRNLTDEMQVTEAYYPESKFSELKWLSYTIVIKTDSADEALAAKCERALLADRVEVEKKTKSKDIVLADIRPMIRSASAVLDGDNIKISCVLSADSSAYLSPEYIIKALKRECGILSSGNLIEEYSSIMRECAYREDMSPFV